MIVADGIRNDADSYVSLEYADDYFLSRNETSWESLKDVEKMAALVKATDYVDNIFDWNGVRKSPEQTLNFPRKGLRSKDGYLIEGIPNNIKQAVCEAVLVLVNGSQLYQSQSENGRVTSETIGQISFSYDVSSLKEDKTLYGAINYRLRGLFRDNDKQHIVIGDISR